MANIPSVDLSIILTAHAEGILAHKTTLSVLRAVDELDKNNIAYEIIIHIDNGDTDTLDYYKQHDKKITVYKNSFGNPAESRNFAIKKSTGKYITLLDGDDLISRYWFIDALKLAQNQNDDVIVRPQYHFHFGESESLNHLWIMDGSFSKDEDALILSYYNRWTLPLLASRDIMLQHPFKPALNGYAYEDWLFNADIIADNIRVLVAEGSVLFYRRRRNSVSSIHTGGVLNYSPLFDIEYIKSINTGMSTSSKLNNKLSQWKQTSKKISVSLIRSIRQSNRVRVLTDPTLQKLLYKKNKNILSPKFIEAWKDINSIENQLYPTNSAIRSINFHPLSFNQHNTSYGLIYKQLCDSVSKLPDYIFMPPDMGIGGTEKVIFNYINALKKVHPNWHFAVIGSYNDAYSDILEYPESVDFIDFKEKTSSLSRDEKYLVWSRLLIQLRCKRLHIINNEEWYGWAYDHLTLLKKNNFTINTSMFMREQTKRPDHYRTFADPQITNIYPAVNKIFTDNTNIVKEILSNNAFDKNKIVTHFQPVNIDLVKPKSEKISQDGLRILWASRLARQKRPDLLPKIFSDTTLGNFTVDVYGSPTHYTSDLFKNTKNITYKGPFKNILDIPTHDYDVLLYTSDTDGLPNVILEVAALGLPILASNAGGVSDFIANNKTGYLVKTDDIEGYRNALTSIYKDYARASQMANNAQQLLHERHSEASFVNIIKNDF